MSSSPETERPRPGLRERKKAKTRSVIQDAALRLFQAQGYDATTVEQIADAAEVSPSTFFRYFPSKEDVVLHDRYDPLLIAAFHNQPAELAPIQALRAAVRDVFTNLPPQELAEERQRAQLIVAIPGVRARALAQLTETVQMVAGAVAERAGRKPDDPAVVNLTGALIGVAIATVLTTADDPNADYLARYDAAMAHLEAGLPL